MCQLKEENTFKVRKIGTLTSVTGLGNFLKFLLTNFLTKVAQIFGDLLGG